MVKKITYYWTELLTIFFLFIGCLILLRSIYTSDFSFVKTEPFTFSSKLDPFHPGILEIQGNAGDHIQIYLLDGSTYRNVTLTRNTTKLQLPTGYYEISRNGGDGLLTTISNDKKTILRK